MCIHDLVCQFEEFLSELINAESGVGVIAVVVAWWSGVSGVAVILVLVLENEYSHTVPHLRNSMRILILQD